MKITQAIKMAFASICSTKLRSFLTMLGIIIGIASIIAIVSTIKGTSEQIKEDLIGAGNNTVSVSLNYGDSEYDPEYGMSDGTAPPLLSDQQKEDIKSTTGAGDSFVAGVISGILDGLQIEDGIKRGLDFSYQTLDVTGAVNPNIKKG